MKDLQSLVDLPVLSWKFWESDWQLQRIRRCSSTLCRYKGTKEECIARTGTLQVEKIQAQSHHSPNPNSCWCVRSMLPTGPQILKVWQASGKLKRPSKKCSTFGAVADRPVDSIGSKHHHLYKPWKTRLPWGKTTIPTYKSFKDTGDSSGKTLWNRSFDSKRQ